jgi:NAD(P)-dependent dehydrogenase (short-subunit alcohol dehydrogenase family)
VERVALVTGAATGIGLAVAERLQADGFALGFHSHRDDENARARFEEAAARGPASWVVGDVTEPGAADRLVGETVAALGRLDVLVNNAGITVAKPALELTADDFDAIFSVDVKGAFLLSVAAAKEMRRQGDGGAIVNVTSVHEHVPRPGFALYAAAKAALGMLTRSLALELAPDIRVNAVAPGAIATERNEEADELDPQIPLGRPGTPAEVASLVSYLAGDEAGYVSGASVLVDGAMAQQVVGSPAW